MHVVKTVLYPNNEIRCIHYNSAPKKKEQAPAEVQDFVIGGSDASSEPEAGNSVMPPSLDISSDLSQSSTGKKRMRTKFGATAKNTILRLGGAYDTIDRDPSNYIFLTGTIPGGTHEAFQAVAEESTFIVQRISDWLSRTAPSDHWFYVWELQRRGALHIHYCLHPNNPATAEKVLSTWRDKWEDILNKVSARRQVDIWMRADGTHHRAGHSVLQAYAQRVHKSVAAYMAGYCSNAKDKHAADDTSPYYPSRWWGCSRKSTSLLKGLTQTSIVEHTNYRAARLQIDKHHERVLHDTPKVHRYPHKVGVGSTVISYHPEDKGQNIWAQLTMTTHTPVAFPNASSWILAIHCLLTTYPRYIRALKKPNRSDLQPLLRELEDSTSLASLTRYSLHQRHLRTMHQCQSVLSLNTLAQHNKDVTMSIFVPPIWLHARIAYELKWNPHGWLNLENDISVRLTDCWSLNYLGTNEPKGSDDASTGGSSETQEEHPFFEQLQLWRF